MADRPWPPPELVLTEQDDVFMTIYVVYRNPKDYPGMWVVRAQYVVKGRDPEEPAKVAKEPLIVCHSLEEARDALPWGVVRMERMERDDPKIYEWWL